MSNVKRYKHKRRLSQVASAEADPAVMDEAAERLRRAIAADEVTAAAVEAEARVSAYAVARHLLLTLQRAQHAFLSDCRLRLRASSSRLSAIGCWSFFTDNLQTAVRFGVEDTFRELVYTASGVFANPKMLRQTRCHRPPQLRETPASGVP